MRFHRGHIDDRRPVHKSGVSRPDTVRDRSEILGDQGCLTLGRDIDKCSMEPSADIVHEHIDRAEFVDHRTHEPFDGVRITNIKHLRERLATGCFERFRCCRETVRIAIADGDVSTECSKRVRRRFPNALSCAGHDHNSIGERQMIGDGGHRNSSRPAGAPTLRGCPFRLERPSSWAVPKSSSPSPTSTRRTTPSP